MTDRVNLSEHGSKLDPPVDPLAEAVDSIRGLVSDAKEEQARALHSAIEELRKPTRSRELDDLQPAPEPKQRETVVSLNQPQDAFYRSLHAQNPELKECRTPELDHYVGAWLMARIHDRHDLTARLRDKIDDAYGTPQHIRAQQRAGTILEGALDVSDPTAILDGSGGDWLPQPMADAIAIARDRASVLGGLVTNLQMTSATLRVPTMGAWTVEMLAEGGSATQGEPAGGSVMLKAQKNHAFGKISIEQLADMPGNHLTMLTQRAGTGLGANQDVQICTSNGTPPNISGAIAGGNVDEASSTVLIYEDLVTLFMNPAQVYADSGVWLAGDVVITLLSQLMDGNDHPILSGLNDAPLPVGNSPGLMGTVFGRRVYRVPLADGTLIFGDPRSYVLGRRQGIVAEFSRHADFQSGLVQMRIYERLDGDMVDTVGLKQMAGLATVA